MLDVSMDLVDKGSSNAEITAKTSGVEDCGAG